MMVFGVLFWGAIVAGIAWLLSQGRGVSIAAPSSHRPAPLDILNERYARGELTPEQYEQMRHDPEETK